MADETVKDKKKNKDKQSRQQKPSKARTFFRDFFSELKKVTWPSFSKVIKQTGVVLMVTICFLLVLMAFDSLFSFLYDLLISGLNDSPAESLVAAVRLLGGGGLL